VSLFGEQVVPFNYAGLTAGRETHGLRFSENENFNLKTVSSYLPFLKKQGILADPDERKSTITDQVSKLKSSVKADPSVDAGLLDEVNNLVEAPTALLANFDENHLTLPSEVLVGVMKKHQRYFPVQAADGRLMPHFITVRNGGSQHLNVVARGNEEVIEARFADASFFMREDSRHTIDDFIPRLDTLIFHPKLGSMLDKTQRITVLTKELVQTLGLDTQQSAAALEASSLCKADLVTKMVVEMTSLQGVIGRYYALKSGKSSETARAIEEHYYPRFAGDQSPESMAGLAVGMADRLDSLIGLFAAGMAPSGTKDPFGLRRAAIGLVQNLVNRDIAFDLRAALSTAAANLPVQPSPQTQRACFDFIAGRFENLLLEEGRRYDVVKAVLAEQADDPSLAVKNIEELTLWSARSDWNEILPAFSRCVRITRELDKANPVDPKLFQEPQEKELYKVWQDASIGIGDSRSIDVLLSHFVTMIPAINEFFNTVLVMAEDQKVRDNRLGLLQSIAGLAAGRADFSRLEGF
jgi:glycyl-tRNA synthetase